MGYWRAVVYIALIGPLLEEVVFRLPLSLKKRHIALACSVAVFLFTGAIFHNLTQIKGLNLALQLSTCVLIYTAGMLFVPAGLSISDHRFRKQLIILSMCLFGLMHIGNYIPIQWPLIWIYPIYVLPQLLMGWAITFIRFKNGFWWGYALHCIINCVSLLLTAGRM
nr:CPBP family glutamic-type intramembrane protease [Mucilaginibacter flavidus]